MQKDVRKFGTSDKRGRVNTSNDPYLDQAGLPEPALCPECGAVYRKKRWFIDTEEAAQLELSGAAKQVVCPACRKIKDGYAEGFVTLQGAYLWQHEAEICNMLRNEEQRAMAKNPLERIISMGRSADDMLIETTEEKLAEHLGRALHKAHQGELKVTWADDHAVCRVDWRREQ
jgi:NMD protein affecting ribosome stability and mRNA decay